MNITKNIVQAASVLALFCTLHAQPAPASKADAAKKAVPAATAAAPVDINNASQAELEALKGVGPATAKKIIAGRPYASVADLSKAGLTKTQVQNLTPLVKVGAAPAAAAAKAAPAAAAAKAAPGGGSGKVWVNKDSKIFHREGDRWYGKTKEGSYMTEADALKAGYREAKESAAKKKK